MGEVAMTRTASDILVESLMEWGVEVIFGLPGDGINGVIEALRTRQDKIRFIQTRHEAAAAFAACAYAKWTGRLGVCLATTGPGGTNLLTGLYDAKFDRAPVLVITGLPYTILSRPTPSKTSITQRSFRTWPPTRQPYMARSMSGKPRRLPAGRHWPSEPWRTLPFLPTFRNKA
jgi:hypothetical protein